MARHSVNYSLHSRASHGRGFVLSFSTFALALFLVIFAQIQYSHIHQIQLDSGGVHQLSAPGRVLRDIALDLNVVTGISLSVDQNDSAATITISGSIPDPVDTRANLLRFQSDVATFGIDSNTSIQLDLNKIMDSNFVQGLTNKELRWQQYIDGNNMSIAPSSPETVYPITIDVNIWADMSWGVPGPDGNITPIYFLMNNTNPLDDTTIFSIHYFDINSANNETWAEFPLGISDTLVAIFTYNQPNGSSYTKNLAIGPNYLTSISASTGVTWKYSIAYTMPSDANGTWAGYDMNAFVRGQDFNVDTNVLWMYNG